MIAIAYNDKGMLAELTRIRALVKRPEAVMKAVGREGVNLLKKHFRAKDRSEPNKLGGKREHFWNKIAQSINQPVVGANATSVTVVVSDPRFAQKVFGGRISAKEAKVLTIPVAPEAYGRSPRVFEQETGLKLVLRRQNDNLLLSARVAGSRFLQVEYLLTPFVDQRPDPTALPKKQDIEQALLARANTEMERQLKQQGGTTE